MHMYNNVLKKPLNFKGFAVQPNGAILVKSGEYGCTNGWVSVNNGGVYADDSKYLAVYFKSNNGFELKWLDYWDLLDLFGEQIAEQCYHQYMEMIA